MRHPPRPASTDVAREWHKAKVKDTTIYNPAILQVVGEISLFERRKATKLRIGGGGGKIRDVAVERGRGTDETRTSQSENPSLFLQRHTSNDISAQRPTTTTAQLVDSRKENLKIPPPQPPAPPTDFPCTNNNHYYY